jgi:branched-chain amino acid transport system ATP-binding protein
MAMLEVRGLSKRYGGLLANNDISFDVEEGRILGVIGPNGAGKSTLFDLITGYQLPDSGEVHFAGKRLRGLRPDQINRLGVGRTFQKLKPFTDMTVEENVMVGVMQHTPRLAAARRLALEALDFVGLLEMRKHHGQALSTGQRKRLELARAMATRPRLLLMDEVTGGIDQRTLPGLISLVQRLKKEGMTLVIIEHNMQVLMSLADDILALHLGRKIAQGSPEAIQNNQQVIESYLGGAYA